MTKLEANKKMIGKRVRVLSGVEEWLGEVVNVLDEQTFLVKNELGIEIEVDIFDIRSL